MEIGYGWYLYFVDTNPLALAYLAFDLHAFLTANIAQSVVAYIVNTSDSIQVTRDTAVEPVSTGPTIGKLYPSLARIVMLAFGSDKLQIF